MIVRRRLPLSMKWLAAVAVGASLGFTLAAQEKLTETVEVRVVNVDVVVTDRSGNPVHGLTKDDFEIFEDGKKQTVTNLYEISPESPLAQAQAQATTTAAIPAVENAPAESRRRRVMVFIDNYSLDPARRADVLKSVARFIEQQKKPDDEVALVSWNRSANIVTPFTSDPARLTQGITTMSSKGFGGLSFPQEKERVRAECQRYYDQAESGLITYQDAFASSRGTVRSYAEESYLTSKILLDGLKGTLAAFAGMDGKKVMVFAGAHLPQNPGEDLAFWLYRTYQKQMRNLSAMNVVDLPRTSQRINLEDVAALASADDVAMYFIDGGDTSDYSMSAEQRGAATSGLEQMLAANNTADAFRRLAEVTGGSVVTRWQNFDVAFDSVARDLNSYYSVGFKPQSAGAANKRIAVKTKNPDYRVRARMLYTPKSLDTEINQRLIANLVHGNVKGDWSIAVHTGPPERDGKYFKIPMEISIAPTLTLLPAGNDMTGGYTVYIVMGNSGAMSKVMKTVQDVRVPAAEEAGLRKQPLTFTGTLMVRPGENTLSVAVVDRVTNATGYARTTVTAQ